MKALRMILCVGLLLAGAVRAQERTKTADESRPGTPLNVQVVFSDYEGEKKVGSIPYTLSVIANDPSRRDSRLRMGVRVPIQTSNKEGQPQVVYMDVGVNIDCSATALDDGRYKLAMGVERSSIYASTSLEPPPPPGGSAETLGRIVGAGGQPTVRQFRSEFNLLIRDGQTIQNTLATDPVSGRVLKVDVTLNVVK